MADPKQPTRRFHLPYDLDDVDARAAPILAELVDDWTRKYGAEPEDYQRERLAVSARARAGLEMTREAESRHAPGSCTFRDLRGALEFYFSRAELLQGANAAHPRSERGLDGAQHHVRVDGGRGGDLHEVLTTVATIERALVRIAAEARQREEERKGRPGPQSSVPPESYAWMIRAHYVGIPGQRAPASVEGTHGHRLGAPWTIESIAAALGCGKSTAQRHMAMAMAILRDELVAGGVVGQSEAA